MSLSKYLLVILPLVISASSTAQQISLAKSEAIFSAIKGQTSRPDSIQVLSVKGTGNIGPFKMSGDQAAYFKIISYPKKLTANKPENIVIVFEPAATFTGIARATATFKKVKINLTGLSTKALEGENEAPLAQITDALGYKINLGWQTLANHLRPELQGEELAAALFTKASPGQVEMVPVARYSPDFPLNFGYYKVSEGHPVQKQIGILAKADKFPEHQTLFPRLSDGQTIFDPGNDAFGLYAISPSHTAYSEDIWNILFYPTHARHSTRIYPVTSAGGVRQENTYLVCIEEAANGDYNDYVFLLKNVKPVLALEKFETLFNGKDFNGWYTWLLTKGKNVDPEKMFVAEPDGSLHILGKEVGYLMNDKSYGNFHFVVDFKWGDKRWPPREAGKRDSGICYNIPDDEPDHIWPASVECQVQEGDTGDFWLLGNSTIIVNGKQNIPLRHSQIVKMKDAEKPKGEWNTVEVISFNGKCVHVVNGVVVNYGENASLVGGRILLQSEYAEVFYRNVKIRELP